MQHDFDTQVKYESKASQQSQLTSFKNCASGTWVQKFGFANRVDTTVKTLSRVVKLPLSYQLC